MYTCETPRTDTEQQHFPVRKTSRNQLNAIRLPPQIDFLYSTIKPFNRKNCFSRELCYIFATSTKATGNAGDETQPAGHEP